LQLEPSLACLAPLLMLVSPYHLDFVLFERAISNHALFKMVLLCHMVSKVMAKDYLIAKCVVVLMAN